MAYTEEEWTDDTPATPARLNHLETQYAAVAEAFNNHLNGHKTRYYTRTEMLARYMQDAPGLDHPVGGDCDTVGASKLHAKDLGTAKVNEGIIAIWDHTKGPVPAGWRELTEAGGLYIMCSTGASGEYPVMTKGGNNDITPVFPVTPCAGYALNIQQIPQHVHGYEDWFHSYWPMISISTSNQCSFQIRNENQMSTSLTDGNGNVVSTTGQPHSHNITITAEKIDNRPRSKYMPYMIKT